MFAREITAMAHIALERIQEYRALADPQTAKTATLRATGIAPVWAAWNQFMAAALAGDILLCRKLQEEVLSCADCMIISGLGYFVCQSKATAVSESRVI